jgi:pimeloyl-ACP methyl ester carboxylesterase
MPHATNGDVTLYYQDEGEGRPVLLLHGHTLDHRIWDWIAPDLVAAGLRLIRPDLRGHGRSERPARGYHWTHHAADVAAVTDAAGAERVAVVGYSLGGGVALEMALTMADRVDGLVLLSPVLPDRPFEEAFFVNLRDVARTIRSDGVTAAMLGPWMVSPLWSGSLDRQEVRQKIEEIVRDFPGADYLASERDRVDREWTVPERLGEVAAPTLVVVGECEMEGFRAFAEENAEEIPDARLEVLDGLGHLHVLENPRLVARLITEHLSASPEVGQQSPQ